MEFDEASSLGAHSTYGLVPQERIIQGASIQRLGRKKLTLSAMITLLCVALGFGYIYMNHESSTEILQRTSDNSDFFEKSYSDNGNSNSKKNAFVIKSKEEDAPRAMQLKESTSRSTLSSNEGLSIANDTTVVAPLEPKPNGRTKKTRPKQLQLPTDASERHPVSLLYEMKLTPEFNTVECKDDRTIVGYKMLLSFSTNGTAYNYAGYGKKLKDAKYLAAKKACHELWNLNYPVEELNTEGNDFVTFCP